MSMSLQLFLVSIVLLTYVDIGATQDDGAGLSAAVRKILLPIIEEIKDNLTSVKNDLSGFNEIVINLSEKVSHLEDQQSQLTSMLISVNASMKEQLRSVESKLEVHETQTLFTLAGLHSFLQSHTYTEELTEISTKMDTLDSKLDSVNSSIREELRAIESQFKEHETQTLFTLAGLHSFLQSNTHTEELTEISTKMDTLDSKLDSVNNSGVLIREDLSCIKEDLSSLSETMNRISEDVEEHDNHTTTELMNLNECLQLNTKIQPIPTQQPNNEYTCGGTGGWRRVVHLNMTDPNTNCPSGWQLTSFSKRTCGRVSTSRYTCDSVTFPVSGGGYTRVCGRIIGYQDDFTDGFEAYHTGQVTTINGAYVTGVSLTHGSPRQHIWTFAAGDGENNNDEETCPCDATINIAIPPFVGGDYFCESGVSSGSSSGFHPDDPLWDGQNCIATSTCCSFNSPPYFTKQLPSPTTNDIEARICFLDEDTAPIEFIELYVQ